MLHVYINILIKLKISNKKFQIINFCFLIGLIFCEKLYAQDYSLLKVFNEMNPKLIEEDWFLHDPSRVINFSGGQMIASTGKAQEDGYHCGDLQVLQDFIDINESLINMDPTNLGRFLYPLPPEITEALSIEPFAVLDFVVYSNVEQSVEI